MVAGPSEMDRLLERIGRLGFVGKTAEYGTALGSPDKRAFSSNQRSSRYSLVAGTEPFEPSPWGLELTLALKRKYYQ